MQKLKSFFNFAYINFGPLIGFYFANYFWGFKTAVIVSIVLVFVEFAWLKLKAMKVSRFFYFTSFIVVVFGILDLIIQESFFFKLEAPITNLLFSLIFGVSLFKNKSIVQEIAETQGRTSAVQSEDKTFFFKFYTLVWTIYFILKAITFLWINLNTTLDEGFVVRLIIGSGTFWAMMFFSVGMPKVTWKLMERLSVFPSQRLERAAVK